jgi:hypothetical protein
MNAREDRRSHLQLRRLRSELPQAKPSASRQQANFDVARRQAQRIRQCRDRGGPNDFHAPAQRFAHRVRSLDACRWARTARGRRVEARGRVDGCDNREALGGGRPGLVAPARSGPRVLRRPAPGGAPRNWARSWPALRRSDRGASTPRQLVGGPRLGHDSATRSMAAASSTPPSPPADRWPDACGRPACGVPRAGRCRGRRRGVRSGFMGRGDSQRAGHGPRSDFSFLDPRCSGASRPPMSIARSGGPRSSGGRGDDRGTSRSPTIFSRHAS